MFFIKFYFSFPFTWPAFLSFGPTSIMILDKMTQLKCLFMEKNLHSHVLKRLPTYPMWNKASRSSKVKSSNLKEGYNQEDF